MIVLAVVALVLLVLDHQLTLWQQNRGGGDELEPIVRDVSSVGFVVPSPKPYPLGEYGDDQYPQEDE